LAYLVTGDAERAGGRSIVFAASNPKDIYGREKPGRHKIAGMPDGRRIPRYDSAQAVRELSAADAKLGELIRRTGPFTLRLKSAHSPFEALLESIVYQQLNGRAAAAILRRVLELSGGFHPSPQAILDTPDEPLRGAGLSGNKLRALRDLAAKTLDGTVPTLERIRRMPDEEIISRLKEVRGIGQWTVEMLLMFRLGRPDVLPVTDYGVRKGFLLTFQRKNAFTSERFGGTKPVAAEDLPKPDVMLRRAEKWRPWRSVASWYLWRACDLHAKKQEQPE
jgi:DNA-3-methyladenine glycosylase II